MYDIVYILRAVSLSHLIQSRDTRYRGCVENGRLEEEGQSLLHFLATIGHVGLMNILLLWMTVRGILSNYINRQWHRPLGIPVVVEGSELTENR